MSTRAGVASPGSSAKRVSAGARVARAVHALNPAAWLVIAGLVLAWQLAIAFDLLTLNYLPAPTEIAAEMGSLISSGQLFTDVGHTLRTTVVATGVATLVGVTFGLASGLFATFRLYSTSSIDFLRTIPVTALVPAALLIWGPSDTAEVTVAAYAATWPILINTAGGVRAIPQRLYDVATVLRLSRWNTLRKIVVPAGTQSILVGLRLGTVTALVLAIVAEMLINPKGLGWGVIQAQNALRPERLWAYTITVGILAYLLNMLLVWIVRRTLPGSASQLEAVR